MDNDGARRTPETALKIRRLSKSFDGALALDAVDLDVRAGEILGLLGQNGSGKSTLVKILTGVHEPDEGEITVFDRQLRTPVIAPHAHGIAVIHQDLGLVDRITVLENLGVNAGYGTRLLGAVPLRSERRLYQSLMKKVGVDLHLDTAVERLSPAERSLVAVIRALRLLEDGAESGKQIFILDEPTASLSGREAQLVLDLMRTMADRGAGVVFISHRLAEVIEVCHRVTVLRAGRVALADAPTDHLDRNAIVASMLGTSVEEYFPHPRPKVGPTRVQVVGLTGAGVTDVSFDVAEGEVVGLTGLAGMGQNEVCRLLTGADARTGGTVHVDGEEFGGRSPAEAIRAGVVLLPGDRLRDGAWGGGTAQENLTLPMLGRFFHRLTLRSRAESRHAASWMETVQVVPPRPERPFTSFSGGNQQKIALAKWLQLNPSVMVLEEPTQGVDPGAAHDLLGRIVDAAAQGAAVVVCSGDYEQLAEICHRVLVFSDGRIVAELSGDELTESGLMLATASRTRS